MLPESGEGPHTLWSSHQSTFGLPVSPAALRTCVGFTCRGQRAPLSEVQPMGADWQPWMMQQRSDGLQYSSAKQEKGQVMQVANGERRDGKAAYPLDVRQYSCTIFQTRIGVLVPSSL